MILETSQGLKKLKKQQQQQLSPQTICQSQISAIIFVQDKKIILDKRNFLSLKKVKNFKNELKCLLSIKIY